LDSFPKKVNYQDALKVPPHDIEIEQSVLGGLMIDKNSIIKVADTLVPSDFYSASHQKIYDTALRLYENRHPIDILSLSAKLKERNYFDEVGGHGYLASLVNMVPTASHILHYANVVKEKRILRDLISASFEIAEHAFASGHEKNVEELLDEVEQKIFNITQRSVYQQFISLKEELIGAFERIEKLSQGSKALRGLATGFEKMDQYLSGFQKSDLILIGARPSLGKTSLALDIVRHVGVKLKEPVGVFSLEMSREQVVDRLLAAEAQINLWNLRNGRLSEETDFMLLQEALDRLSQSPIFIDDTPSPNIMQMRTMARRLQVEHGLSLLVVDYLQLIQPRNTRDNMVQQITEISRSLKALARELNIPILAVSQLSRSVDQREVKVPRLSDLRESGALEQDSDVVLLIYRKDRERADLPPEEQNTAEIIIAKHRNGPLGTVKLRFDQDKVSFKNIDYTHDTDEAFSV